MDRWSFANDAERIESMRYNLRCNAAGIAAWAQKTNADLPAMKAELVRRCPLPSGVERDAILRLIEAGTFDKDLAGILGCY